MPIKIASRTTPIRVENSRNFKAFAIAQPIGITCRSSPRRHGQWVTSIAASVGP